jgi:two-component system KDP operon response regulator KdpE
MAYDKEQDLKALVVDDEKSIRRFLKASLSPHGYNVIEATHAREGLDLAFNFHPDIIILDLCLPDMDGVDVTRKLREKISTPIIILSIRENEKDKIAALDAGADDYLTKPFSMGELLARLRALMRRIALPEGDPVFTTGDLVVDFLRREVSVKAIPVHLTPTEYEILKLLVQNAGRVMTHRKILKAIWDKDEYVEGIYHLLRVTMSNLRNKIESNPERPVYILTDPGVGYRLRSDH